MRTLLVVIAALVPATTSFAGPSFDVVDHGESLEVIAREMIAAKLTVAPVRSRLEVPLVGQPVAERVFPAGKTIRQIELDGNATRSLSVKLDFEREDVRAIAPHARVTQVGNDVHLVFPKKPGMTLTATPTPVAPPAPPAMTHAVVAPVPATPTPTPAPQPMAMHDPHGATTPATPDAHGETPGAAAVPAVHGSASTGTTHAPAPPAAAPNPPATALKSGRDSGTRLPTLIAVILAAVGAGAWMLKRKKNPTTTTNTIDVLAQRSLGKHARIVWLSAGQRELIVAVTPQQVRVLGQWKPGDGAPPPMARLVDDAFAPREATPSPREGMARAGSNPGYITPSATSRTSPAISGLLKLREKAPEPFVPPISEDVASGDADADLVWARELIAATGPRK